MNMHAFADVMLTSSSLGSSGFCQKNDIPTVNILWYNYKDYNMYQI